MARRGPGEDDQHQQQRLGADMAGDRDPAQQRRRRTGQAADDDILRCRSLKKACVDHRIAQQRSQRGDQHLQVLYLVPAVAVYRAARRPLLIVEPMTRTQKRVLEGVDRRVRLSATVQHPGPLQKAPDQERVAQGRCG